MPHPFRPRRPQCGTGRPRRHDRRGAGRPCNAKEPASGNLYGAVNYVYDVDKHEITIQHASYSPSLNSGSSGYSTYATQSHTAIGNTIGSGTNQANYCAIDT